jgi:translocation and assembly module TamB
LTEKIAIPHAALLGRPVPRLDVHADATNLRGALDAHVSLDGEIDRKPARGSLHIARPAAGGAFLDGDVSIGPVSAQGGCARRRQFAAGQFAPRAISTIFRLWRCKSSPAASTPT